MPVRNHAMTGLDHGRSCQRCHEPIRWRTVRFVGSRTFCGEMCATLWLSDAAARAAWERAKLEMGRRSRDLPGRLRLAWIAWRAARAQRRLDRRLDAGPDARSLPWFWLPSPQGTTALLLALAACGVTGGPAPETRVMAPVAANALRPAQTAADTPLPLAASVEPERPAAAPGRHAPARSRDAAGAMAEDITRGDLTAREVAFTFDGGADANVAGEILDGLRARNAHATMFLTGQFIRLHPDLVRRMVAEGHEVGNHLDTHPHLTTYERDRRQQTLPAVTREILVGQLRRTEESFHALTGQPMAPFWRAPFGEHNPEIRGWAAAVGYRHISWTRGAGTAEDLDTRDWVADRSSRTLPQPGRDRRPSRGLRAGATGGPERRDRADAPGLSSAHGPAARQPAAHPADPAGTRIPRRDYLGPRPPPPRPQGSCRSPGPRRAACRPVARDPRARRDGSAATPDAVRFSWPWRLRLSAADLPPPPSGFPTPRGCPPATTTRTRGSSISASP